MAIRFRDDAKAFIIPAEAWFGLQVKNRRPHMMIGFYYETFTYGEFKIEWTRNGIQLQAYSDSWQALGKMPELIELMAEIDRQRINPSIHEFAHMLECMGYKDITPRTRPLK